ncbi:putative membrane protein YeaQ/YmgE (transglycosylase-associated protein family) [Povalibacter uvarum]|uniref:Putative membrane protein YeaQ/YmgE (Transglycosylase-associated protein family) n=1 Tax=Povalibacter uvarum TaxID=732238 RepID=A0A841HU34_9GAMM|nr:GlsB/YeaQ/YmgE family stress response membrane protein [Povalibacter uvarum]MBB6096313.1 putative membrane protein YeaQ/YmgE (transglycosylase-associated protein family) [Povalibacter uvarum]
MNVITWLLIGGLVGWLASIALRIDSQERIFLDVAIGIVGAVFSGWFLTPLLGVATMNQGSLSTGGVLVSFFGAVIAVALANVLRYATRRIHASGGAGR